MNTAYPATVTSEQLALLPTGRFEGEVVVVCDEDGLREACNHLSECPVIGFDTETRPSFKAGNVNRVSLIQLSTEERCYLFRLCRTGLTRPLMRILESRKIVKVGADVKGDLRALQELRRFRPASFVDLQTTVHHWGLEEKSVRKMAAIIMGVRISKAQRLSNWEAAELTPAQCSYAATDAWICLEMYRRLAATDTADLLQKAARDGGQTPRLRRREIGQQLPHEDVKGDAPHHSRKREQRDDIKQPSVKSRRD